MRSASSSTCPQACASVCAGSMVASMMTCSAPSSAVPACNNAGAAMPCSCRACNPAFSMPVLVRPHVHLDINRPPLPTTAANQAFRGDSTHHLITADPCHSICLIIQRQYKRAGMAAHFNKGSGANGGFRGLRGAHGRRNDTGCRHADDSGS